MIIASLSFVSAIQLDKNGHICHYISLFRTVTNIFKHVSAKNFKNFTTSQSNGNRNFLTNMFGLSNLAFFIRVDILELFRASSR